MLVMKVRNVPPQNIVKPKILLQLQRDKGIPLKSEKHTKAKCYRPKQKEKRKKQRDIWKIIISIKNDPNNSPWSSDYIRCYHQNTHNDDDALSILLRHILLHQLQLDLRWPIITFQFLMLDNVRTLELIWCMRTWCNWHAEVWQ